MTDLSAVGLLNLLADFTVANPDNEYDDALSPEGKGWASFVIDQPDYRANLEVVRAARTLGWYVYDEAIMKVDNDGVFEDDDEATLAAISAGVRVIKLPDKIGSPDHRWYLCARRDK